MHTLPESKQLESLTTIKVHVCVCCTIPTVCLEVLHTLPSVVSVERVRVARRRMALRGSRKNGMGAAAQNSETKTKGS